MDIKPPRQVNITYPIVPASVFKHHTDDLETLLTMFICRIHESKNLSEPELLSNSAYLSILANQIALNIAHYQGDLIHAYTPTQDDEHPDYM